VEKALGDELFENGQARGAIELPEAARLREIQAKPGHLRILGSNPVQERILSGHGAMVDDTPFSCICTQRNAVLTTWWATAKNVPQAPRSHT